MAATTGKSRGGSVNEFSHGVCNPVVCHALKVVIYVPETSELTVIASHCSSTSKKSRSVITTPINKRECTGPRGNLGET